MMQVGVAFPHRQIGADAGAPRRFLRDLEALGFDYVAVADHVLGADTTARPGWNGPYDVNDPLREIFVLLGYLAGITSLELMTAALVLPQRQTAVVAKQAAEVDILTRGAFRLGVAVGWNPVEFEGLGADFRTRGMRVEEQVHVLRLLWTERVVSFAGRYHTIDRAGIHPQPVQRPIPLWFGGAGPSAGPSATPHVDRVIDRIGRLGDGWISSPVETPDDVTKTFARIQRSAEQSGRDPAALGLQSSLRFVAADGSPPSRDAVLRQVEALHMAGATRLTVETRSLADSQSALVDALGTIRETMRHG